MRKILSGILLSILIFAFASLPVWAISNPTSVAFGTGSSSTYAVFEHVYETGDMLFIAEGFINYAVEPTDYRADQAFVFEILNTAGNVTILSTPVSAYGDRPTGIYQTAAQVTSNGLVSGTAYVMRLGGNPLVFPSQTGNSINATLGAGDYYDNTNVISGFTPLRNFVINEIATNMQTEDGVTTYKTVVLGVTYLSTTGANLFLAGIPGLDILEPSIFSSSNQPINVVTTNGTGAYGASLNATAIWGTPTANGFNAISTLLFGSSGNGGHVFLFVLGFTISMGIGVKVQSPLVILVILALMPLFGSLLGLINLAAALTITLIIIILGALLFARSVLS